MENSIIEIERIIKQGIIQEIDGQTFSPAKMYRVVDNTLVDPLDIHNLSGLVNYIAAPNEGAPKNNLIIVIENYDSVKLYSILNRESKIRELFVRVSLMKSNEFPFGVFLDSEEFIIKIKSLFQESDDRERLLKYVSRLTIKNSVETLDDGISQSATVKSGMSGAVVTKEGIPSILSMAPFRTFRELQQPVSCFLFRMRQVEGRVPACALFEADGGEWRNNSIDKIRDYLSKNIKDIVIIA